MNGILIIWVTQFTHTTILQATGRTLLTFVTSGGINIPCQVMRTLIHSFCYGPERRFGIIALGCFGRWTITDGWYKI